MRAIRQTGTIKVAVIPVQFTSAGSSNSGSNTISSQNLQDMAANLANLHNFYNEVTYGTVNIQLTVIFNGAQKSTSAVTGSETCITLSTMSYYANTPESVGYRSDGLGGGQPQLIRDAVDAVSVSTADFDTVIVVHAGYGNESTAGNSGTDNPGDIWSVQVDLSPAANGFDYGIVVPMMESGAYARGVICHEFGHFLGLPDLYNTNTGDPVVGSWCLMDYGSWENNGLNPTHPSAWCKKYLGLVDPQILTSSQTISGVLPIEISSSSVYEYDVPSSSGEYFLVCFSTISQYNQYVPGTGILIWHIDEAVMHGETLDDRINLYDDINIYSPKTVAMVPAGNSSPANYPYGDQSNAWPGIKTVFTSPQSDSYSGSSTSLTISNFLLYSSSASFFTGFTAVSTSTPNTPGTTTSVVYSTATAELIINPATGEIKLDIPAGTFSQTVSVTLSTAAVPVSHNPTIKVGNICLDITDSLNLQPNHSITLIIHYDPAAIAALGLVESKLAIFRYDPLHDQWLSVPFTLDTTNHIITANISHFSTFVLVQVVSVPGLPSVKIYPNPFNPNTSTSGMTVANLTSSAVIKIYNISGELIRTLNYNGGGQAVWDGTNETGNKVASGIYIIFINSSDGSKTFKVAIEK